VSARRYLPWVRAGAGNLLTGAWGPARAAVTITAAVNSGGAPATVEATLYGPGDVTGIDARQVINTDPKDGATDFESTLLPCVEFDEPALPWLFTPAAAADDRLRPWLVLVVLPADAATLDRERRMLTIPADAGTQLPDLDQSWAWAHVQVTAAGDPVAVLADPAQSDATLSRLVCPRRLAPDTAYLAAVVPATAQGAQAGLRQPVDAGPLQPAWTAATDYLELPVYYPTEEHSWLFSTGPEGDFETLVSRLRRVRLPADGLRGRPVDLTRLRTATGTGAGGSGTVLPGALGGDPTGPAALDPALGAALRALLDLSAPGPGTPGAADLPLALPTYGRWHAAARSAPMTGSAGWVAQLNLHPAARAVAAIGTRIVQTLQEELMSAAWQQAGQVDAANQLLRHAQLARAAGQAMLDRLNSMPAAGCVAITAAVHGRVLDPAEGRTLASWVRHSRVPEVLLGAGLRRALRALGPLGRRLAVRAGELVTAVNDATVTVPTAPPDRPPGTVTVDSVASDPDGVTVPPLCSLTPRRLATITPPNEQWVRTMEAVAAHQRSVRGCERPVIRPRPRLPLDEVKTTLLTALDPELTVPARVADRVDLPADWHPADPLEPVLAAPELATPVYREVLRLDPQLILPAPDALPQNSVTSVRTNPWFIAAVMAGANHEMCREMLWRGFPTDQRATCLRHFWDRSGRQPAPGTVPEHDIDPMTDWDPATSLASHAGAGTAQTVVLLRGELLRRFPHTTKYLARARRTQPDPAQPATYDLAPVTGSPGDADYAEKYAVFIGDLPPDIAFLGFDVSPEEAIGSDTAAKPGYFLVFQEPLTGTRFGMDAERPAEVPFSTWAQLAWTDVKVTRNHVDLAASSGPAPTDARGLHFDRTGTSAQLAAALEQQSFRAAIHLSNLLEAP
jgi:hypothetical protein